MWPFPLSFVKWSRARAATGTIDQAVAVQVVPHGVALGEGGDLNETVVVRVVVGVADSHSDGERLQCAQAAGVGHARP